LKRNSVAHSDNKYLLQALKRANNKYAIERHLENTEKKSRKEEGKLTIPGSLPLLKKISSGPHTPEGAHIRGLS